MSDAEAVFHQGGTVYRVDGLEPDTEYEHYDIRYRTLPRPGPRLATLATVNDVHFGETVCGIIEGLDVGPTMQAAPDEPPYPEMMNAAAIAEITAVSPDAVIAKGDLTTHGTREEYDAFLAAYSSAFGDRLHHVRGNHDAYHGESFADWSHQAVELPGVVVAILDTVIPGRSSGRVTEAQLSWLDDLAAGADRPVLVFGHHHVWNPQSRTRPENYFGILPDDSERLIGVFARRRSLCGYFAGHTHRNRVRRFPASGDAPFVEVACVKDFPGTWAEYRVYEGGILQIHHRISSPDALDWTDRTRAMFAGMYPQYAFGSLAERCFAIWPRL